MNQDSTEKKSNICLKKEFGQTVSSEKKIRAQVVSKKKNSCNLKIPLPPHHFSNGPSLRNFDVIEDNEISHFSKF